MMMMTRMSWIKFSLLLTSSPVAVFLSPQPSQSPAFVASNNDFVIYGISVNISADISLNIYFFFLVFFAFAFMAESNALVMHAFFKDKNLVFLFKCFLCSFHFCDLSSFIEGALCCCSQRTRTWD